MAPDEKATLDFPEYANPTIAPEAPNLRDEATTQGAETIALLDLAPSSAGSRPSDSVTEGRAPRRTVLPRVEQGPGGVELTQDAAPRYSSRGALGAGGIGEVEEVIDNDIGRTVALKRLRPHMANGVGLLRFADEVRTVGRLEHPNIVPIHDVGVDEQGRYYFVMKHVRGETLDGIIKRLVDGDRATHERYPFERRMEIFRGILQAIEFAHSQGILHRDIKPSNVMVGEHGEVVVLDWGLARPIGGPSRPGDDDASSPSSAEPTEPGAPRGFETRVGSVVGTPLYMSPEQAQGEPLDERSDIYSLSVLLFEFLGLKHYLSERGSIPAILEGVVNVEATFFGLPKSLYQPVVPMDLAWFTRKGLLKDKSKRYQSVREMIQRLDDRAEGRIPIQCHVTFSQRVGREILGFSTRHPALLAIGYLLLLSTAVYGIVTGIRAG